MGDNDSLGALDASYQFTVTMVNAVPSDAFLEITVPDDTMIPSGDASGFSMTCTSGCSSSTSFSYTQPTLTVSNLFSSYVDPATVLDFTIVGWTNPSTPSAVDFEMATF